MAAKGPAGAPTSLRILRGDRPARINRDEPQPPAGELVAPSWLPPFALAEWNRIAPALVEMGVAKPIDVDALAAYCSAVARFRTATEAITAYGITVENREGVLRPAPAVGMATAASSEMRQWARELGLTPSARQGLRVTPAGGAQSMAEMLSGAGQSAKRPHRSP